jgi:hypothetical protein
MCKVKLFYGANPLERCEQEKKTILDNIITQFDPDFYTYLNILYGVDEHPYVIPMLNINNAEFPLAPAIVMRCPESTIINYQETFIVRHFYYLFQIIKFLNYFAIHNNLNGNNLYYNNELNMITLLDCGSCSNPKDRFSTDKIDSTYGIETFIHNENIDQICSLVKESMNASVSHIMKRDTAVHWKNRIVPWKPTDVDWDNQIKRLVTELRKLPTDLFTRYVAMKRDLYSSAVSLHSVTSYGFQFNHRFLTIVSILMRHPNPLLRPSPTQLIKLFNKVCSTERYETSFTYTNSRGETIELCTIPSYIDESSTISIHSPKLNTEQIEFSFHPFVQQLEYVSYFINIHMLYIWFRHPTTNLIKDWVSWVNDLPNDDWKRMLLSYSLHDILQNPFLSKTASNWNTIQQFVFMNIRDLIMKTEQAQYSLRSGIPIEGKIPLEECSEPFDPVAIDTVLRSIA